MFFSPPPCLLAVQIVPLAPLVWGTWYPALQCLCIFRNWKLTAVPVGLLSSTVEPVDTYDHLNIILTLCTWVLYLCSFLILCMIIWILFLHYVPGYCIYVPFLYCAWSFEYYPYIMYLGTVFMFLSYTVHAVCRAHLVLCPCVFEEEYRFLSYADWARMLSASHLFRSTVCLRVLWGEDQLQMFPG